MKMKNKTYKILGLLLTYPSKELLNMHGEMNAILRQEAILAEHHITQINKLFAYMQQTDLLDLEEQYVSLFDTRRLLSLYLFEHVHGDSRDRGQAMVDLTERYEQNNMQLNKGELPDYLPTFLEFLSTVSYEQAKELLDEPINIIAALAQRLKKHDSLYHVVLDTLLSLSASQPNADIVEKATKDYDVKPTDYAEVDKQWQEPEVFSNAQTTNCMKNPYAASAINTPIEKEN